MRRPDDEDQGASVERRYRTLFEHMSEGFVLCEAVRDEGGRVVDYWIRSANPIYLKRAPSQIAILDRRQRDIRPTTPETWFDACRRALNGEPVRFDFYDDIGQRWYEVHMARLSDREFGQFFVDITERKRFEQRQAELFDELNHRVKNNLAVVSSILGLQARGSRGPVRDQLERARDRVAAISDLHAALSRQKSAVDVSLCTYLAELVERLTDALCDNAQVQIRSKCEEICLPDHDAVDIGLIINELVTNAAKHAFPAGTPGEIEVVIARSGGVIRLDVSDNGRGFDSRVDRSGRGLGMRIVQSLVDDLAGELSRQEGPGTTWRVEFPVMRPR